MACSLTWLGPGPKKDVQIEYTVKAPRATTMARGCAHQGVARRNRAHNPTPCPLFATAATGDTCAAIGVGS